MREQAVERKLVAILATDVAGYSRLVGLDEEGTRSRVKALAVGFSRPIGVKRADASVKNAKPCCAVLRHRWHEQSDGA